eukprot:TRINITY_DN4649_c0_g1_i2.p1 TRINITY_DN4649_c0_g1~~TRINITY_DN4649_c0_g1_i2.p1  ORF type:complete len:822 (+),score=189.82 TRINITY_DN4649_c0_g1_i2:143-2608(+)
MAEEKYSSASDLKEDEGLPSSAESSSDSSDSEEEEENAALIQTLEDSLAENPYNYDAHVQYISSLRKAGNVEKLQSARIAMSSLFPLSPKMWQEWAKDETCLDTSSEAVARIESLYEKGIDEYLSVPLWLDYLKFIQEHDESVLHCTQEGLEKMRNLFERAIPHAGLHVTEGGCLWTAYRKFEDAVLITMDESSDELKTGQIDKIRTLFRRQLSIPLANNDSTLEEYKSWEKQHGIIIGNESDKLAGLPSSVISAFVKANDMYNARIDFEESVSEGKCNGAERLQNFMRYINFEKSSGDPTRVQLLYERAVTEFPVTKDLWLSYTDFLDSNLKVPGVIKVYARAVRNCPWVGVLWTKYMLALERSNASEDEISAVFEQSLQCSFSDVGEYLDLFLLRADGLRRKITKNVDIDQQNLVSLRKTFQRAAEYFNMYLDPVADLVHLYSYWSRLECQLAKDISAARNVWEELTKKRGMHIEVWKGYIDMEVSLGNISEARAVYKRCYSKKLYGNGSQAICESWLRFEREYGSLEYFDLALKKVAPRLKEVQSFQDQEALKHHVTRDLGEDSTKEKKEPTQNLNNRSKKPDASKKRKANLGYGEQKVQSKFQKVQGKAIPSRKDGQETEPNDSENTRGVNMASDVKGGNDFHQEEMTDSLSKPTFYTDKCTAFISNLSLELFQETGGTQAIRLLRDRHTGKSRGLAYIDFEDDEKLSAALAKNKTYLLGKKISVAKSNPQEGEKKRKAKEQIAGFQGAHHKVLDKQNTKGKPVPPTVSHRRAGHVKLEGSNTFAVPRTVARRHESHPQGEEAPKSNEEFRKLLLKP